METYKVFKLDLAVQLIRMGNEVVKTEPNLKNPKYAVFIFKATKKLFTDIDSLKQN